MLKRGTCIGYFKEAISRQKYSEFKKKNPGKIAEEVQKEIGVIFRQMNASEKAKYGVLPSGEGIPTCDKGKAATKFGKVIRKALPTIKGTRKVQCRCSVEEVCSVISSLTDEQKTTVTSCGFGLFLRMKAPFVKSSLIFYLIDRVDTKAKTLTIQGYAYSLTRESFKAVIGLLDGGKEIVVYDDMENNSFRDEIIRADGRILLSDLVLDL
ncbi:High mobility group box domain containing protein [Trema orientale]|uniref:High mobility group box domain containing protein n=1 Tax=Trema orientale TaxID=63057 RepID=A0A2P5FDA2_TREOI|nr:High mobility group box domain containing protein [Trema orientale]